MDQEEHEETELTMMMTTTIVMVVVMMTMKLCLKQEDTTAASAPGLSPSNVGALLNAFVQKSNTQAGGNYPARYPTKR